MTKPTNPAEVDDEIWKWYVTEGINSITRWHPGATEKHPPPEDEEDSERSAAPSRQSLGTGRGRPGTSGPGRARGSGAGPDDPGATAGLRGHAGRRPWPDNVLPPGQKFGQKSESTGRSGEQAAAEEKPRRADLEDSPAAWTRTDRATFDWSNWAANWTPPTKPATSDRRPKR